MHGASSPSSWCSASRAPSRVKPREARPQNQPSAFTGETTRGVTPKSIQAFVCKPLLPVCTVENRQVLLRLAHGEKAPSPTPRRDRPSHGENCAYFCGLCRHRGRCILIQKPAITARKDHPPHDSRGRAARWNEAASRADGFAAEESRKSQGRRQEEARRARQEARRSRQEARRARQEARRSRQEARRSRQEARRSRQAARPDLQHAQREARPFLPLMRQRRSTCDLLTSHQPIPVVLKSRLLHVCHQSIRRCRNR